MCRDIESTVKLHDMSFKAAHSKHLESMKEDSKMQLYYILKLLELKKDDVKELFTSSGQTAAVVVKREEKERWADILKMHVKLLC